MSFIKNLILDNNKLTPEVLHNSLGSFWTQVFSEKGTIKGYTLGQAEELVQSYYKLIDVLLSLSVKHIPIFSTVRWQPLIIKKSKYNKAPLKFISSGAVFGAQPSSDRFYAKQIFRFGLPKSAGAPLYSYTPDFPLKKFSVISDRIIAPGQLFINNVDVLMDQESVLYFNKNIFEIPSIPKAYVVNDDGEVATFINSAGEVEEDTFIILWIYHAERDEDAIYEHFGKLFDLRFESSEDYRRLLQAIFDLFVGGPSIINIKAALGAFSGVVPTRYPTEIVEDIYTDNIHKYVITDKTVYKFKPEQTIIRGIEKGSTVYAGTILVDAVEYFDVVVNPTWWESELKTPKLGLSSHIFLGNYKQQLFFKNGVDMVTYSQRGEINFPVEGHPQDVQEFQKYINSPDRKAQLCEVFGLAQPGNVAVINPVEFIFSNFLKNCTALIKLNFSTTDEISSFFDFLPVIRKYLPAHVYLLFYANVNVNYEIFDRLNGGYYLPGNTSLPLGFDGGTSEGFRPYLGNGDIDYYKDYIHRLFCISVSPLAFNNLPLHKAENLDKFYLVPTGKGTPGKPRVTEGKMFTSVPNNLNITNREIPTVLIIDFS